MSWDKWHHDPREGEWPEEPPDWCPHGIDQREAGCGKCLSEIAGTNVTGLHQERGGYIRATVGKSQKRVHQIVAEAALGRPLPNGAQVHHVNGDKSDNRGRNLVICESVAYHVELHRKARIKALGGDPWTQHWCNKCSRLRPLADFYRRRANGHLVAHCKACVNAHASRWKDENGDKHAESVRAYKPRKLELQRLRRRAQAKAAALRELSASDVLSAALVVMLDKIEGGAA